MSSTGVFTLAVMYAGCDRHLFGLQVLALGQGIQLPQLFTDKAYTLRFISTSLVYMYLLI